MAFDDNPSTARAPNAIDRLRPQTVLRWFDKVDKGVMAVKLCARTTPPRLHAGALNEVAESKPLISMLCRAFHRRSNSSCAVPVRAARGFSVRPLELLN